LRDTCKDVSAQSDQFPVNSVLFVMLLSCDNSVQDCWFA